MRGHARRAELHLQRLRTLAAELQSIFQTRYTGFGKISRLKQEDIMVKIKQIIPVPQGKNYYAVYRDECSKSGYVVERLDYLALVKGEYGDLILDGLSGYMEPVSYYASNYFGTFSEDILKCELPELWEEIKESGVFQDKHSLLEQSIMELRDKLNSQSRQIDLLNERIAEFEKGKSDMAQGELTNAEKVYGIETVDFDNPVLPLDDEKNDVTLKANCAGISETQTNNDIDARNILLNDLRFGYGKRIDFRTIKALTASGMKTLGDVADKTFDELLRINSIGKSAMNKISAVLRSHGLTLKDEKSAYLKSIAKLKKKGKTLTEISDKLDISLSLVKKYLQFVCLDLQILQRRSTT